VGIFLKSRHMPFLQAIAIAFMITKDPYAIFKNAYSLCNPTSKNTLPTVQRTVWKPPVPSEINFADMLNDKRAQFMQWDTVEKKYIYSWMSTFGAVYALHKNACNSGWRKKSHKSAT